MATDNEVLFLLQESETSWKMIIRFEDRRMIILAFHFAFLTILVAFVLCLLGSVGSASVTNRIPVCSGVLLAASLKGLVMYQVLRSERAAADRYRKKVNLIREVLLHETTDPKVKWYRDNPQHAQLGILLSNASQLTDWGHTLGWIRVIMLGTIAIQVLTAAGLLIWTNLR